MNVEFINPFLSSLMNVLETMAMTKLEPGKPSMKKEEISRGDVSGIIGMASPQTKGSLSVTFEESLALSIMEKMLGERPETRFAERMGIVFAKLISPLLFGRWAKYKPVSAGQVAAHMITLQDFSAKGRAE